MSRRRDRLLNLDRQHCWHPYTQHGEEEDPLPVVGAKDAELELVDGRRILDGISSWWACLHGHAQPELITAMAEQAKGLDHVLFAGATHEPAAELAAELCARVPGNLSRVFYSDDGSTAVEVAVKMVAQAWRQRGEEQRRTFIAFEGSYHGDTFGAMSLGDPDPFFRAFEPFLFPVERLPLDLDALHASLERLAEEVAGVVIEPLVQGAAGMRMHSPEFLQGLRAACDQAGIPLIADEVMTGFGRTGSLFACAEAGIEPDLLCLAKGLTGGMLPLAATLCREDLFAEFLAEDRSRAFFHGHTFTANPIACAVARASLRLCEQNRVPERLAEIGNQIESCLQHLRGNEAVRDLRRRGGIVAVEMDPRPGEAAGYLARHSRHLREAAVERGVLLRPLGNVIYAMPPACTTPVQAERIAAVLGELTATWCAL
ncbi:MAG: adenosylmethionine--8-amino-7-oxononanoate transaminase [Planctomycetota bacterium]|jgi:adenosylmethionine-8-amino-7-oxononanoate aminotransferase